MNIYSSELFVDKVDLVCKKIFELFHTSVIFVDKYDNKLNSQFSANMTQPYVNNKTEYLVKLFIKSPYGNVPLIECSIGSLYYFAINLILDDNYYGKFIIGPSLERRYTKDEIRQIYKDDNNNYDIELLHEYYAAVNTLHYETLVTYAWLCRLVVNEICDYTMVAKEEYLNDVERDIQVIRNKDIIEQKIHIHSGYNADKIMFECVKNGYRDEVKKFIKDYFKYTGKKELLNRTIRDRKNFSISFIAMITQAAIEGGMDYEMANKLNLKYIYLIESKSLLNKLEQLELQALIDFADRVKSLKSKGYTKLIRDCQDYITENISQDLKIYNIAKYFDIDAKYLSKRFKKETNETIKNYLNRTKVEEAKRMIQSSNILLIDLAVYLSFNDQSHFTRVFKQYAKITPNAYQKKIKSI